jgi:hypothetical protein
VSSRGHTPGWHADELRTHCLSAIDREHPLLLADLPMGTVACCAAIQQAGLHAAVLWDPMPE